MLATGPLLAEILNLGITINSIRGESDSEYMNANNGYFSFTILQGRNMGVTVDFSGRRASFPGSYHNRSVPFTGLGSMIDQIISHPRRDATDRNGPGWGFPRTLGGNVYSLTITDKATKISASCSVTLTNDGGYVEYGGSSYGVGETITFDFADLR